MTPNPAPPRRVRPTLAAALATPVLLAGCAIGYQGPRDPEPTTSTDSATPSAAAPATTTPTEAPTAGPGGTTDPGSATGPVRTVTGPAAGEQTGPDDPAGIGTPLPTGASDVWDRYAPVASVLTCPDGTLGIQQSGAVVHVADTCTEVSVTADAAVVLVDSADVVTVVGTGNVLVIRETGRIAVGGDANVVQWTGGSPDVADSGVGNTVRPSS